MLVSSSLQYLLYGSRTTAEGSKILLPPILPVEDDLVLGHFLPALPRHQVVHVVRGTVNLPTLGLCEVAAEFQEQGRQSCGSDLIMINVLL